MIILEKHELFFDLELFFRKSPFLSFINSIFVFLLIFKGSRVSISFSSIRRLFNHILFFGKRGWFSLILFLNNIVHEHFERIGSLANVATKNRIFSHIDVFS